MHSRRKKGGGVLCVRGSEDAKKRWEGQRKLQLYERALELRTGRTCPSSMLQHLLVVQSSVDLEFLPMVRRSDRRPSLYHLG